MAYQYNRTLIKELVKAADGTVLTVDHADAYTANDVVGHQQKCIYGTGGGALIRAVKVLDYGVQSEPYIIHFYRSIASTIADDAAFAPTDPITPPPTAARTVWPTSAAVT
jgi:hypothetical protein